eukprot:9490273-Pyramimonas_sp.AAC.1
MLSYGNLSCIKGREIRKPHDTIPAAQRGRPCRAAPPRHGPGGTQHAHPHCADEAAAQPPPDQPLVARAGQVALLSVDQVPLEDRHIFEPRLVSPGLRPASRAAEELKGHLAPWGTGGSAEQVLARSCPARTRQALACSGATLESRASTWLSLPPFS